MQEHAASDVLPAALASAQDDLVQAVHAGAVLPAFRPSLDVAQRLFRHVVRARIISARMVALQRGERIGFHSSSIGEEAAVVASILAMRDTDWVFPGAREWYAALQRGLPLAHYVHHAFGSAEDPAKGHAAPDHLPARSFHVVPPSGVVGAHLPQAVGAAWAAKIRQDDVASVALFAADIAASGDFHNALNFAGVFRTPVVFVCRSGASARIVERAVAYGLASARVDGGDALAVFAVVKAALARAIEGKGTTLVELVSSPLEGLLSLADSALSAGEVLELGDADPLVRLRSALLSEKLLDAGVEQAIVRETSAELDAAIAAAESAGAPSSTTMFDDVYAGVPAHLAAARRKLSGG